MKQWKVVPTLALLLAAICGADQATAQVALPTASRTLQLSAFGGVSPVFTGLAGGRNFSITAGGDLGFLPYRGMRPSLEVRGTYPADKGNIDSQKSILGGLKIDFLLNHRFHPYGDILFGRGEMNYRSGYLFNNSIYLLTTTNVISPGAGFDYDVSDNFAVKLDGQFQHWGYAPTPSGSLYSKVGTVAVVYRFNFAPRHRR